MTLEELLQRAAISAMIIAFGTVFSALFVRLSITLTARMLGTATPTFGVARTLLVALCLTLVSYGIGLSSNAVLSGSAPTGPTIGRLTIPLSRLVRLPFEFFLLAGLMIRFLPTTVARGCMVSMTYQLLHIVVLLVIVVIATLGERLS